MTDHFDDYITLPNQKRLRVRPLRQSEERPVRELYEHLSERSRANRFFQITPTLPDSVVRLLTSIDYRRTYALVVEHDGETGTEVVGLANLAAVDGDTVELGLVVRDDWQHQRVGTELARRLLDAADILGFDRFLIHMRTDNTAARRLLQKTGDVVSTRIAGGEFEVTFVRH